MFIFYFLGVGLPCRSILCQFWLCEEAQCVYLRRHLGSPAGVLLSLVRGRDCRLRLQALLGPCSAEFSPVLPDVRVIAVVNKCALKPSQLTLLAELA